MGDWRSISEKCALIQPFSANGAYLESKDGEWKTPMHVQA